MSDGLFELDELPQSGQYLVLARKYRPRVFSDMIGQDVLVQTFSNAVKSNRIAHAFLLTGIRGVGKTTTARIIARALNCVGEDGLGGITTEPCGKCYHCISIMEDRNQDVIEIDAASHTGVNDIREVIENARYRPINGRFKVYIIDEVHMLSGSAFNALLKTLEEPPMHVKFIFATTELRKIPMTILSRCQRFDLRRVEVGELVRHFQKILDVEKVPFEDDALKMIAKSAGGSVRDGLSILDQAISHTGGEVRADYVREMLGLSSVDDLYHLYSALLEKHVAIALDMVSKLYSYGVDPVFLVQDLLNITHMLSKTKTDSTFMQSLAENEYAYCRSTLSSVDILRLNRIWMVLLKGYEEVKGSYNPLISLEMLVIRLCNISQLPDPEKLLQQLYSVGSVGSKDFTASLVEGKSSSHALSSAKIANDVLPISFGAVSNEVMPGKGDWYKGWPGVAEALLHQDEMILYHHVRTDISVVEFGVGEISVVLRNGATKSIIESLRNFLNNNTKIQWIIKIIEQNDDNIEIETLAQLLRQEHANKQEAIARHRDVKLMLESFDGLEIAEIKVA